MARLHNIWRATASLPLVPANADCDRPTSPHVRFQELAQVWEIAHSPLLAGPHRWNNLPLHLRDSEHTFLKFHRLLKNEDALVLMRTAAPSDCFFCVPHKSAFTLHSAED